MVRGTHTAIEVSLFGYLIIRVTVRINRAVQLLKCHESSDKLVVGMKQAS
jgi:hypothetical protein